MKWLATVLCLLAFQVTAQEHSKIEIEDAPNMPQPQSPESKVIQLPFLIQCVPVPPDTMLKELYGEIGFLDGKGSLIKPDGEFVGGEFRMFLDPEDKSYTIMLELGSFSCMVLSGEELSPMTHNDGDAI